MVPVPKKASAETLSLRVVVVDPPPNILWALQLGQEELVKPALSTKSRITFDFAVDVVEDSSPAGFRLGGPAVQGRRGDRFVYLRIGAYAGQVGATAGWRAKIGLEGITPKLVSALRAKRSGVLEVQFMGTGPKGGPACATVPLLGAGWYVK
jgi:Family of unknown function (DUF5990)